MIPVPKDLVKTKKSPAFAFALDISAPGFTVPKTAKPYFGSESSTVWPPEIMAPASWILSAPPFRILVRISFGKSIGRKF